MKKGQSIIFNIVAIAFVTVLGSTGVIALNTSTNVNKVNIETNKENLEIVKEEFQGIKKSYDNLSLQNAFINGKIDAILNMNKIDPKIIEEKIIKETFNNLATTTQ